MKTENRILLERAIGILEGASFCAGEGAAAAITCAVEMLDDAIKDEMKPRSDTIGSGTHA